MLINKIMSLSIFCKIFSCNWGAPPVKYVCSILISLPGKAEGLQEEGYAENLFIQRAEQKEQTKEDVYNRLAVLSGRIVETPHKEPQSRPQAIDMNRYLQLKQMQQMRGLELG